MANRSKDPKDRSTASIVVRCSPELKADVDEMFKDTSNRPADSLSEFVRDFLAPQVKRWKKGEFKKEEKEEKEAVT